MNILYIGFDVESVVGFASYSRHQVRALQKLGHAVFVVSLETEDTDRRVVPRIADVRVSCLGNDRVMLAMLRLLVTHRGRFELVMLNHVLLAIYGFVYRSISRAPYAINAYNDDGLRKLSFAGQFALHRAGLVIANCQRTVDRMPEFHRRMPYAGLLPDLFDVASFSPVIKDDARTYMEQRYATGPLAGRFVISTVVPLSLPPNKGHRQTIDALAKLHHPRYLYLIGGEGSESDAIATYAAERGVTGQVRMLGLVDQEDLPKLYSASDVAVLLENSTSGLNESAPLGLIEAAACGVPFICSNQDGLVELIGKARPYGIAIDSNRPEQLAAVLQQLADNPVAAKTMGENGRSVVEATFSFERFSYNLAHLISRRLGIARSRVSGATLAANQRC